MEKKNVSSKVMLIISLLLFIVSIVIFYFSFCNSSEKNENLTIEDVNTIVANLNDKSITRSEIGESLIENETNIISDYVYDLALQEFFKDSDVTDESVEVQLQILKSQFSEEEWPLYLTYYGGGSEETFKVMLRNALKQESYIAKKQENITLTDDEILEEFNKNPNIYNNVAMLTLFMPDAETLEKAISLVEEGKTITEISETLNVVLEEHANYTTIYTEGFNWNIDLTNVNIGDIVYTTSDSSSFVVGQVTEKNIGIENENVRNKLVEDITYNKAYTMVEEELIAFLKEQKVKIMGVDYPLYHEDENVDLENNEILNEIED